MVRFRSFLGRATGRRSQEDEQFVYPYNPQPESPEHSIVSLPNLTPPITAPPFVPRAVDPDSKVDLSATYSPGSDPDGGFPVAPPGYVSREPSTNTPPVDSPHAQVYTMVPPPMMPSRASPPVPPPAAPYRAPPGPLPSFHYPPRPAAAAPSPPHTMPARESMTPAPADLPLERAVGQKVTPEELHELADMIRQRYQLDIRIHRERTFRARDRDITEEKIRKAEALLGKITRTVDTWNDPEYFEPGTRDYENFQEIVRRIHLPGKRDWIKEPPWADAGGGRAERRRL